VFIETKTSVAMYHTHGVSRVHISSAEWASSAPKYNNYIILNIIFFLNVE